MLAAGRGTSSDQNAAGAHCWCVCPFLCGWVGELGRGAAMGDSWGV